MSFVWRDYLAVAELLVNEAQHTPSTHQEAYYRIAISRAYYACLHEARHYLLSLKPTLEIPRSGTHYFIIKQFKALPTKPQQKIGTSLQRFKKDREKADYDDDFPDLAQTAEKSIMVAQQILDLLASL